MFHSNSLAWLPPWLIMMTYSSNASRLSFMSTFPHATVAMEGKFHLRRQTYRRRQGQVPPFIYIWEVLGCTLQNYHYSSQRTDTSAFFPFLETRWAVSTQSTAALCFSRESTFVVPTRILLEPPISGINLRSYAFVHNEILERRMPCIREVMSSNTCETDYAHSRAAADEAVRP